MDYEAPKDAVLLKILLPEGGKAAVGDPIAVIGSAGENPGPAIETAAPAVPPAPAVDGTSSKDGPSAPSSYPPSSPLARSLARDLGLDLRGVKGSGPGGRVVERDVR
jgi:pyruvate dehydrogenase E2 component (dihydrolipoamide acetyltransferase)